MTLTRMMTISSPPMMMMIMLKSAVSYPRGCWAVGYLHNKDLSKKSCWELLNFVEYCWVLLGICIIKICQKTWAKTLTLSLFIIIIMIAVNYRMMVFFSYKLLAWITLKVTQAIFLILIRPIHCICSIYCPPKHHRREACILKQPQGNKWWCLKSLIRQR